MIKKFPKIYFSIGLSVVLIGLALLLSPLSPIRAEEGCWQCSEEFWGAYCQEIRAEGYNDCWDLTDGDPYDVCDDMYPVIGYQCEGYTNEYCDCVAGEDCSGDPGSGGF